jgi:hypothetical protein
MFQFRFWTGKLEHLNWDRICPYSLFRKTWKSPKSSKTARAPQTFWNFLAPWGSPIANGPHRSANICRWITQPLAPRTSVSPPSRVSPPQSQPPSLDTRALSSLPKAISLSESLHMHDQTPAGSLWPSGPKNSGTRQPGSVRSSISSRACDACRRRRRKCQFDDASLRPRAAAPPPDPSQSQSKCNNCQRLGTACTFLLPSRPRGPKRRYVSQSGIVLNG